MKKIFLVLFATVFLFACNNSNNSNASTEFAEPGFTLTTLPGTNTQYAVKKKENGDILEEGPVVNGLRQGTWITYHQRVNIPETFTTYAEGKLNGPHYAFNNRGQIVLRANFLNEVLDGPRIKYDFGKPSEEAFYVNGQLDGVYKTYHRNRKLQEESYFKNGKRDGAAKYYNEKEELIMSYEYKNNEIISGGKVDPPQPREKK
ncbi:MAG TPA: hypothetical protein ENK52_00395 [Saprospiraceae bacterium]|nr:hypothetical protein [Saprospiraceae bacterium]